MTSENADQAIIVTSGQFTNRSQGVCQQQADPTVDGRHCCVGKSVQAANRISQRHSQSLSSRQLLPMSALPARNGFYETARRRQSLRFEFLGLPNLSRLQSHVQSDSV